MDDKEGKELADIPKKGEPASEWRQDIPNTFVNEFGVLDLEDKTIRGVHVELHVFKSPRLSQPRYRFSLYKLIGRHPERAYQQEINCRPGIKPTDHQYSHEHYGETIRNVADGSWAYSDFDAALKRFCEKCNLTLIGNVPDILEFKLK